MAEPLTQRYNNPGAVEFQPWMTAYGAKVGPNGRYAQFDSPDQGFGVMGRVLDTYRDKHGLNTVSGIVERWAPRSADNNSTDQYIAHVARTLGVEPNAALGPEHRSSLMSAMATYEAGRPVAMAQSQPSTQASTTRPNGAAPMSEPRGLGLLDTLQARMMSPLFQSGAAMFNAASSGQNIGAGFLAGGQAAAQAGAHQMALEKARREAMSQQARDQMWQSLGTGDQPAWAASLPAGSLELARSLGPDAGAKFLTDATMKGLEKGIERDKLAEMRRYHDVLAKQAEAQFLEAQNMNAERRTLMQTTSEAQRQKIEDAQARAKRRAEIFGDPTPPAPEQPDPNIQPQSFEGGDGEPRLIQAQVAEPQQAPAPDQAQPPAAAAANQPRMIQTPSGPLPVERARAMAQKMLTDPEYRPLGQQILKDIEKNGEDRGLDKTARGEVEKGLVSAVNHLARLQQVAQKFDPKFLTIGYRAGQSYKSFIESAGGKLTPEQMQDHYRYVQFRAEAVGNVNARLKELSGTAVTEQEFMRLLLQEPNAGTGGIMDTLGFGADNPTKFKAKLDQAVRGSALAIARANYLRTSQNLSDAEIMKLAKSGQLENMVSLPGMERIIDREGNRLEQQYRERGIKGPELDGMVKRDLRTKFGIAI